MPLALLGLPLIVVGVMLHPGPTYDLCECGVVPETPADRFLEYDAIFVGQVVSVVGLPDVKLDGGSSLVEDEFLGEVRVLEVEVDYSFKGPVYETIYISYIKSNCEWGDQSYVRRLDTYLFYLYIDHEYEWPWQQPWHLSLCNPSMVVGVPEDDRGLPRVDDLAEEELFLLNELAAPRAPEPNTANAYPTPRTLPIATPSVTSTPVLTPTVMPTPATISAPTPTPHSGGCTPSPGTDLSTIGMMAGIVCLALRRRQS